MTITKRELVNNVAAQLGDKVTQAQVFAVVEKLMSAITEELAQGNDVVFRRFGRFETVTTKAKVGRNPKKPEAAIAIPETKKVKFKVGKELKDLVAGKH